MLEPRDTEMMVKQIDLSKGPMQFEDLVSLAKAGVEVILMEGTAPLARIVPLSGSGSPRVAGLHPGSIDVDDDFDAPLPDEFWIGAE